MKFLTKNGNCLKKLLLDQIQTTAQRILPSVVNYTTELYPYTSALYKKNFKPHPVKSRQEITHDYVYTGDERLPTLSERLKDFKDPIDSVRVNIGRNVTLTNAVKKQTNEIKEKIEKNKSDRKLEIDSSELKIKAPLDEITKQEKLFSGFKYIQSIADHYNINKDLFEQAYFVPTIDLQVNYESDNKSFPIYYGNKMSAQLTEKKPLVKWEDLSGEGDKTTSKNYHTLLFLNMDGNFNNSRNQVLLWFMSNIKSGDLSSGKELMEYVQPFPMRGTGWHRCVYLLFEHDSPVEFDLKRNSSNENNFSKRDFKCSDFVLKHQKEITPVGLSFFQTTWDMSVKKVFHDYLNIKEPIYEFDFETKFIPLLEKYPRDQPPFNWYLQDYMDKKDMNEVVMKDYLKELSPFESYPEPAKYPLIDLGRHKRHKWYKYEIINQRKRRLQYNIIPHKYASPFDKLKDFAQNLPYQQKQ